MQGHTDGKTGYFSGSVYFRDDEQPSGKLQSALLLMENIAAFTDMHTINATGGGVLIKGAKTFRWLKRSSGIAQRNMM